MLTALLIAAQAWSPPTVTKQSTQSIVELAVATPELSTLVAALKAADLVDTLSGPGPFTVFAPTNAAFAALPAGVLTNLLKPENKAQLVQLLTYHVLPGAVATLSNQQMIKTLEGQDVEARIFWQVGNPVPDIFINRAKVEAEITASNGVVYIVDAVLNPPGGFTPLATQTRKLLIEFKSAGAWASGGNNISSIPSAKSLADGAATTFKTFSSALNACKSGVCEDVYFNYHTNYSFIHNPGMAVGLARAQLVRDELCDSSLVKCWTAKASAIKTNKIIGLPHLLPVDAGTAIAQVFWYWPFGETDFTLFAELNYDTSIQFNADVIGAHLHTGLDTINGPVNIIFCGSSPLPASLLRDGACKPF